MKWVLPLASTWFNSLYDIFEALLIPTIIIWNTLMTYFNVYPQKIITYFTECFEKYKFHIK